MKPLLINTYDVGGAGKACMRLQKGLLEENIEAKTLVKKKKNAESNSIVYRKPNFVRRWSFTLSKNSKSQNKFQKESYISNRDSRLELFSYPDSDACITCQDIYNEADIINLHWVSNFLDFDRFFKRNSKPVVWTLHDVNPFSGGEHYNEEYLGMDHQGFPMRRELTILDIKTKKEVIAIKKEALSNVNNLTIVVLNKWMANEVRKSELFKNYPVKLIPNGVDSKVFKPYDCCQSRNKLGLPLDKKVILFVADSIENERKGFQYLDAAFKKVNDHGVVLCAIGKLKRKVELDSNIISLGVIKDEYTMSLIYSAADIFVIPSLIDNLPNTIVEAHMCGTPVIGFPVGGIVDMITPGINGILTDQVSVSSLLKKIEQFLAGDYKFDANVIRKQAVDKYDSRKQASAYTKLFQEILEKY